MKKIISVITLVLVLSACGASLSQTEIDATVNAKVKATLNAAPVATQPAVPSATAVSLPPTASMTSVPSTGGTIELVALTSPVSSGANASITIRTSPNANCSIAVTSATPGSGLGAGNSNPSLVAKTAGVDGVVSWTWALGAKAPTGTRQIVIDCVPGGHADYAFEVQ